MATLKQIENLHKCKNKFRHRWIDRGRAKSGGDNYIYDCKYCGCEAIKICFFAWQYKPKGSDKWLNLAPECVDSGNNRRKRR